MPNTKGIETSPFQQLEAFALQQYQLRYNVMSRKTECRRRDAKDDEAFQTLDERIMNTLLMDAREIGIDVKLSDVKCLFRSCRMPDYHPIRHFLNHLPEWDGVDRVTEMANRVSHKLLWVRCFHIWSLGLVAQWMGRDMEAANSLMPILVSEVQGWGKSTFCRNLLPPELRGYYADQMPLNEGGHIAERLSMLALVNLDEFDRLNDRQMATLKNVLQEQYCSFRMLYTNNIVQAPRMASVIATSNSHELLTDPTGSRRFVCVDAEGEIDRTPINYQQYYAQLKEEVLRGERTWLTHDEEKELAENNKAFYRYTPEFDIFCRCFRVPDERDTTDDILEATAPEIYQHLCQRYPKPMRGTTAKAFPKVLLQHGVERIHRRDGNFYRVVML